MFCGKWLPFLSEKQKRILKYYIELKLNYLGEDIFHPRTKLRYFETQISWAAIRLRAECTQHHWEHLTMTAWEHLSKLNPKYVLSVIIDDSRVQECDKRITFNLISRMRLITSGLDVETPICSKDKSSFQFKYKTLPQVPLQIKVYCGFV